MKTFTKIVAASFVLPLVLGACGTMRRGDTAATQRNQDTRYMNSSSPSLNTMQSSRSSVETRNWNDTSEQPLLESSTLSFNQGSAMLTAQAKRDLQNLVQAAKARGDIEDIKVAVWSDKALPASGKTELSDADKQLAERRADAIEEYLEDTLDTPSVEAFNMAERANWVARLFNTEEAELRSSLARRNDRNSEAKFTHFRQGGPSKAVIVIESEKD